MWNEARGTRNVGCGISLLDFIYISWRGEGGGGGERTMEEKWKSGKVWLQAEGGIAYK